MDDPRTEEEMNMETIVWVCFSVFAVSGAAMILALVAWAWLD
jgi:hypothetical protein